MLNITQKLLPVTSKRRSGDALTRVLYLVAHDTGNDGATAIENVNYYIRSANEIQASAHYFVDDKDIVCCVPETEKAWHVRYNAGIPPNVHGSYANDVAIGIELCYSSQGLINNATAYENYTDLIAWLCVRYALDPTAQIRAHATLDPSRRTDPLNAFTHTQKTWLQFIQDVNDKMPKPPLQPTIIQKLLTFFTTLLGL